MSNLVGNHPSPPREVAALDRARAALLADPGYGTPAYDRDLHAAFVRVYHAAERASACAHYIDSDMAGPCLDCGVSSEHHFDSPIA